MSMSTGEVKQKVKVDQKTVRFSTAPWYQENIVVLVGGVGGIGSWLSFFLARQKAELYLFDADQIDEPNLGGQLYGQEHIGSLKTQAMNEIIHSFCSNYSVYQEGLYTEESFSNSIVFSCFDNMAARKLMFEKWCEYIDENKDSEYQIFIDGRMLAEQGQVYFVTPDKIEEYKKTLFDDAEVPKEDCSYKATSHCGAIIAGLMVSGFNNYIANVKTGNNFRDVPFSMIYELPIMNFKTQE